LLRFAPASARDTGVNFVNFVGFGRAAIGVGLVNGVRGARARRSIPDETDYAQVFE
jgi:hypothetical protein